MADKLIMTVDLDAFFASCEELRHPEVKGQPMVVGFELKGRGIVTTANYLAREKGIKSGMPLFKAKELCKDVKIIHPDHEYYQEKANEVFEVIATFAPKMEVASIDECFIDVTHLTKRYQPIEIAKMIQKEVYNKTKLWTSVGISTNLILSKVASGMDKPQGITTLWVHELPTKLWPLPVNDLYMVGRKTTEVLNGYGVMTIGELANLFEDKALYKKIRRHIGINLDKFIDEANGKHNREVDTENRQLKSLSKDETFGVSLTSIDEVRKELKKLMKYAFERTQARKLNSNVVQVSLKEDKNFRRVSASKTIDRFKYSWDEVWGTAEALLDKLFVEGMSIKFIGVGLSGLRPGEKTYKQLTIEDKPTDNVNSLQDIVDNASSAIHTDVFLGSTMDENRRYSKENHLDDDKVKFKVWGK